MTVIALGWMDLVTTWSKNGKEFSPKELTEHLKYIISHQRSREIPKQPPVNLPKRKFLPTLGTKTDVL